MNSYLACDPMQSDLYTCSVCGHELPQELLDSDAGDAFNVVCRECADAERAQAQEEDEAWQAEQEAQADTPEQRNLDAWNAKLAHAAQETLDRRAFVAWWEREGKLAYYTARFSTESDEAACYGAWLAWRAGARVQEVEGRQA